MKPIKIEITSVHQYTNAQYKVAKKELEKSMRDLINHMADKKTVVTIKTTLADDDGIITQSSEDVEE